VSGVPPGKIEDIIKFDWKDLVFNKRIFDSPSYLREKGKPVVALWGTVILHPTYSMTANTDRDFSILARLWVRRLPPYPRSRSFNCFLHKQLPPRRRIHYGRRSVVWMHELYILVS